MQETLCRRRCLLKIPKNYTGFKAKTNVFAEHRLAGDTAREATSDEVKGLRAEAHQLKELLAELMMENRLLKKSVLADGESDT